jgi:hypothetical protein
MTNTWESFRCKQFTAMKVPSKKEISNIFRALLIATILSSMNSIRVRIQTNKIKMLFKSIETMA